MAVPTIYAKLIEHHELTIGRGRGSKRTKDYVKAICSSKIRWADLWAKSSSDTENKSEDNL